MTCLNEIERLRARVAELEQDAERWRNIRDYGKAMDDEINTLRARVEELETKLGAIRACLIGIDRQAERLMGPPSIGKWTDDDAVIVGYKLNTGLWHRILGLLADVPPDERDTEIYHLRTRVAELEQDAKRYRWLRGDAPEFSTRWSRWNLQWWDGRCWHSLERTALDSAIDAAMREGK